MKKYKQLKSYPLHEGIGTIWEKQNNGYYKSEKGNILEDVYLQSYNEFFAPHVFTTLDNKDIFVGDAFYFIDSGDEYCLSGTATIHSDIKISGKVFSTKAAAEEYIASQNQFKEGDWLYSRTDISMSLFKYTKGKSSIQLGCTEAYQVFDDGDIRQCGYSNNYATSARLASKDIIEDILKKVAIHKGYVAGVKIGNYVLEEGVIQLSNTYNYYRLQMYARDKYNTAWVTIYSEKDGWAEIIKEEPFKIGNYEVVKIDDYDEIKIGCQKYSRIIVEQLYNVLNAVDQLNDDVYLTVNNTKITTKETEQLLKLFK